MSLDSRTWGPEDLDVLRGEGECLAGGCSHVPTLLPRPPRAAMEAYIQPPATLWALDVTGSDPVPQRSFQDALNAATELNLRILNSPCTDGVFAAPCEWPGSPKQHAEGLAAALAEQARRAVNLEMGGSSG